VVEVVFQFSLWDSEVMGVKKWKKKLNSFNSLYEIQIPFVVVSLTATGFQFSLWDSRFLWKYREKQKISFNSLYEIQIKFYARTPRLLISFNSLYEIQLSQIVGKKVVIKQLSILFMRFFDCNYSWTYITCSSFNSLYEIPFPSCPPLPPERLRTFNSLYEIHEEADILIDVSTTRLSILFMRFTITILASKKPGVIITFNSLYEIHFFFLCFRNWSIRLSILFMRFYRNHNN